MCRMLAYLGNDIPLSKLILQPSHSLEQQAWQPKELRETKLNADGFGFAWYNSESSDACRYRNILPIWNDPNLKHLAHSLSKPLWLAIIRSATVGLNVSLENTPPFTYKQWSFMHNGYLMDFDTQFRHKVRDVLSDKYLALIRGSTDSEYIFALLMQLIEHQTPLTALQNCIQILAEIVQNEAALLNIILSDGQQVYALRHAINGLTPTLYYCNNSKEFGEGNLVIASERLNNEKQWNAVDEYVIYRFGSAKEFTRHPL